MILPHLMGQRIGLATSDTRQLAIMYECPQSDLANMCTFDANGCTSKACVCPQSSNTTEILKFEVSKGCWRCAERCANHPRLTPGCACPEGKDLVTKPGPTATEYWCKERIACPKPPRGVADPSCFCTAGYKGFGIQRGDPTTFATKTSAQRTEPNTTVAVNLDLG